MSDVINNEASENMERMLDALHAMFRKTQRKAMIIIACVTLFSEVMVSFFFRDAIEVIPFRYISLRILLPQFCLWVSVYLSFKIEKTSLLRATKNLYVCLLFAFELSVLGFFHAIFPAFWCVPAAVIIFGSVYSDLRICYWTFLYSLFAAALSAFINYHDWEGLGEETLINFFIAALIIIGAYYVGKTMIYFMKKQDKMQVALIEEKMELSEKNRLDALTKLYNKEYIFLFMNEAIKKTKNKDIQIGVAIIDIDDFKEVNDHYGHDKGDAVLVALSNIIHSYSDSKITGGRFGGEEFIIFFYDMERDERLRVLERMRAEFEITKYAFLDRKVTFSGGIKGSAYPHPPAEELFIEADRALYQAKRMGKNRIVESPGS